MLIAVLDQRSIKVLADQSDSFPIILLYYILERLSQLLCVIFISGYLECLMHASCYGFQYLRVLVLGELEVELTEVDIKFVLLVLVQLVEAWKIEGSMSSHF